MSNPLRLRPYRTEDCPVLAQLFYDTIHSVNLGDYTQAQVDAWACGTVDQARWDRELRSRAAVVAELDGQIVGFGDMTETGYLDRLFVHRDYQRRGVASAICSALEARVDVPCYTVHASLTARPFFERRGYAVTQRQEVERRGVKLPNFAMEKRRA